MGKQVVLRVTVHPETDSLKLMSEGASKRIIFKCTKLYHSPLCDLSIDTITNILDSWANFFQDSNDNNFKFCI